MEKKVYNLTSFLIPIGIAVNFIGGQIAVLLKIPIFLDSIGTIVIGALCGGIPGAVVGLITNISIAITNPQTLFYAVNNIAFGLLAGYLARRGIFNSLWKSILTGIGFGLLGGVIGSTITYTMFGGIGPGGTGLISGMLISSGTPIIISTLISEVTTDLTDKIPTLLIVYFILKNIPPRILVKLPQGDVFLNKNEQE